MTSENNSSHNEREFFRNKGEVYLQIKKPNKEIEITELPNQLDDFALKLMNLSHKIKYELTEEHLLTHVSHLLFQLHLYNTKKESGEPPISEKTMVTISASGMDFPDKVSRPAGSQWTLKITFPCYPFETVEVTGEVLSQKEGHTIIKFLEPDDLTQEMIIKFVNQLTRDQKKSQS